MRLAGRTPDQAELIELGDELLQRLRIRRLDGRENLVERALPVEELHDLEGGRRHHHHLSLKHQRILKSEKQLVVLLKRHRVDAAEGGALKMLWKGAARHGKSREGRLEGSVRPGPPKCRLGSSGSACASAETRGRECIRGAPCRRPPSGK
jgi:hypothetical protein